jgi:hypothetical protein
MLTLKAREKEFNKDYDSNHTLVATDIESPVQGKHGPDVCLINLQIRP